MSDPFYGTRAWRRLRQEALQRDGYTCTVPGCRHKATHVDHVISRKQGGADALHNLRSLCARHDGQVKEDEYGKRKRGGRLTVPGCDVNGRPIDPGHWWNA